MALPIGKLAIVVGAGIAGSVLANEGQFSKVSDFFSGAFKVILKHLKEDESQLKEASNDTSLMAQVNSLRQELKMLASSRSITVVTGNSQSGTTTYAVPVIVIGVAGYGYIWWKLLISGSTEGMDVDGLRSNVHYAGGYSEEATIEDIPVLKTLMSGARLVLIHFATILTMNAASMNLTHTLLLTPLALRKCSQDHPVIEMFWEVIKQFSLEQQKKFLKFVTGCSRGPLLGFKYLEPPFCIQRAAPEDAPEEVLDRLPTSATCVNLLKLPPYRSKDVLRSKLLYAISADAGFDLS